MATSSLVAVASAPSTAMVPLVPFVQTLEELPTSFTNPQHAYLAIAQKCMLRIRNSAIGFSTQQADVLVEKAARFTTQLEQRLEERKLSEERKLADLKDFLTSTTSLQADEHNNLLNMLYFCGVQPLNDWLAIQSFRVLQLIAFFYRDVGVTSQPTSAWIPIHANHSWLLVLILPLFLQWFGQQDQEVKGTLTAKEILTYLQGYTHARREDMLLTEEEVVAIGPPIPTAKKNTQPKKRRDKAIKPLKKQPRKQDETVYQGQEDDEDVQIVEQAALQPVETTPVPAKAEKTVQSKPTLAFFDPMQLYCMLKCIGNKPCALKPYQPRLNEKLFCVHLLEDGWVGREQRRCMWNLPYNSLEWRDDGTVAWKVLLASALNLASIENKRLLHRGYHLREHWTADEKQRFVSSFEQLNCNFKEPVTYDTYEQACKKLGKSCAPSTGVDLEFKGKPTPKTQSRTPQSTTENKRRRKRTEQGNVVERVKVAPKKKVNKQPPRKKSNKRKTTTAHFEVTSPPPSKRITRSQTRLGGGEKKLL